MKQEIGVWIDHKQAVIIDGSGNTVFKLESDMEKHTRFSGGDRGKTAYGANYFPADNQIDQRYIEHLNQYYDEVISHLREATGILILGPGEAKLELQKRLEHAGLEKKVIGIETADKLTDRQITARVKQFFADQKQLAH